MFNKKQLKEPKKRDRKTKKRYLQNQFEPEIEVKVNKKNKKQDESYMGEVYEANHPLGDKKTPEIVIGKTKKRLFRKDQVIVQSPETSLEEVVEDKNAAIEYLAQETDEQVERNGEPETSQEDDLLEDSIETEDPTDKEVVEDLIEQALDDFDDEEREVYDDEPSKEAKQTEGLFLQDAEEFEQTTKKGRTRVSKKDLQMFFEDDKKKSRRLRRKKLTKKQKKQEKKRRRNKKEYQEIVDRKIYKFRKKKYSKIEDFVKYLNEHYLDLDEIAVEVLKDEEFYGWISKNSGIFDQSVKEFKEIREKIEPKSE